MPACVHCGLDFDNPMAVAIHARKCPQKPAGAGPKPVVQKALPVAVAVPQVKFGDLGDMTLRDIASKGSRNAVFYLAANQSLVKLLEHRVNRTVTPHTPFFRNMVATIVLETANRMPDPGHLDQYERVLSMKIRSFNRFQKATQLVFLDDLWESCYLRRVPSTTAAAMVDGEAGVEGSGSLPSSIRRVPGTGFFARIEAGPEKNAWTKWNVGFRIDGGKDGGARDDLARIQTEGCTALLKNPDLAVKVVKKFYHEHGASEGKALYIGYENRDLYNESGTCVARSLLGATAFPYRYTHNGHGGGAPDAGGELLFQYLFAIDCSRDRGLDTEKVQIDMGNNSLWRPGEKAFAGFEADRILGWTKIVRLGQPKSGLPVSTGWSFKFVDSKWNWLRPPGGELQKYLEDELATWEPGIPYNISETYDFQVNRS